MSRNLNPVFLRMGINYLWRTNFMPEKSGSTFWNSYSHQFMSYLYIYKQLDIFLFHKFSFKIAQLKILKIKWLNKIILQVTVCFFQTEKKKKKSKKNFYKKLYDKAFRKSMILIKNFQLLKYYYMQENWKNKGGKKNQKLINRSKSLQKEVNHKNNTNIEKWIKPVKK